MHPAPIKAFSAFSLPSTAHYMHTLFSGERIYRDTRNGDLYAVQPR